MTPDSPGLASDSTEKSRAQTVTRITEKLETGAVLMDIRDFSWKEYREVFPQGTVETPIGKVRIGKNQFEKMDEKDNGKRREVLNKIKMAGAVAYEKNCVTSRTNEV